MEVIYIPWSKALRMCYKLAEMIMDSGEVFDVLVTISRGGLVPARIVSDVLGIDDLYAVSSKFWGIGGRVAPEPVIKACEGLNVQGRKALVVDEVVDTGSTMTKVVKLLHDLGAASIKTATLHYKTTSSLIPDYYVEKVEKWVWIFYPWSISETLYELSRSRCGDGHVINEALKLAQELSVDSNVIDREHLIKSLKLYLRRDKEVGK